MSRSKKKGNVSTSSVVKQGFFLTAGSWLFTMIILAVSAAFVLPGAFMVKKAQDAEKEADVAGEDPPDNTNKIIGFVLLGLGTIIGFGFGGGALIALVMEET